MRKRGERTNHEGHARSSSRQARTAATDGGPTEARGRRPIRRRRIRFEAMDRPRLEGDRRAADPPGCVELLGSTAHPVVAFTATDGRTPRQSSGSGRPTRGARALPAWDRSPPLLRRGGGDWGGGDPHLRQCKTGRLHAGVRLRFSGDSFRFPIAQEPSAAGRMVPTTGGAEP